jgi:acetyltransferase
VQGRPCYPNLAALDKHVDLALIATPAETVPGILDQCGDFGVQGRGGALAGFAEKDDRGSVLQERMVEAARRNRIRVLGPNCLGVMRPANGLNAAFGMRSRRPGRVALVSQSGAVCSAMLDWAGPRKLGFSAVVSLGAAADVDFGDVLDYLALDPKTQSILLYVEGIRDARRFMSGLRAAARLKPVVVVKSGRHPAGSRAALSHTGAWVGSRRSSPPPWSAAARCRWSGCGSCSRRPRCSEPGAGSAATASPSSPTAVGRGVLAADRAVERGLTLAQFSERPGRAGAGAAEDHWSHNNPVDVIGDAGAERYRAAVDAVLADEGVDGVLVLLAPLADCGDPTASAEEVIAAAKKTRKPVLTCWMGEASVAEAQQLFSEERRAALRVAGGGGGCHVLPGDTRATRSCWCSRRARCRNRWRRTWRARG